MAMAPFAGFSSLDVTARLALLAEQAQGPLVFTTSFGLEDQVLTHLIARARLPVRFATLDTGRLFPETYTLWEKTERHYGISVHAYYPDANGLRAWVKEHGINGFYDGVATRKSCCAMRKLGPLRDALNGAAIWITGLRADQSGHRQTLAAISHDESFGVLKANPLFDWSRQQAADFAAHQDVPVSTLHREGFLSIGCAPCTRAVHAGEPERAGRWWWEQEAEKECGLHVDTAGRLVRNRAVREHEA